MNLDAISLEQALLDFETANVRVIDLTRRLTSLNEEIKLLRGEIAFLRSRPSIAENRPYSELETELFRAQAELQSEKLKNQAIISDLKSQINTLRQDR